MTTPRPVRPWLRPALLIAILSIPSASAVADDPPVDATGPADVPSAPAEHAPEHPRVMTRLPHSRRPPQTTEAILAERVRLLTVELDLTTAQQAALHDLLARQGEAIRRVWLDRTLTEGERGPITGAIGERTADAIRNLLTPKQREKYNPPRPNTTQQQAGGSRDLSKYLDALQRK